MTDNEKRNLRILLARQKEVRERKSAQRRSADPKHEPGKAKRKLDALEMELVSKLCRPEPFEPTLEETTAMARFIKERIVRSRNDGSVEVTNHGADCYIESKYGPEVLR